MSSSGISYHSKCRFEASKLLFESDSPFLGNRTNTALTGFPFRHMAVVARPFVLFSAWQIKAVRPSVRGGKVKANYVWKNGLLPSSSSPPPPVATPFGSPPPSVLRPPRLHSTQLICCHCLPSLPLSVPPMGGKTEGRACVESTECGSGGRKEGRVRSPTR